MCLAKAGGHVTVTDLPDLLPVLEANVKRNNLTQSMKVMPLEWYVLLLPLTFLLLL